MLNAKSIILGFPSHDLLLMISKDSFKQQVKYGLFNNYEPSLLMHENQRLIYEAPYTSNENWGNYSNMQLAASGWVNIIACRYPNVDIDTLKKIIGYRTIFGLYDFHFNETDIAACREKYSCTDSKKWFDDQADMYFKEVKKYMNKYIITNNYDEHREDRVCFNVFPKRRLFELIYMDTKDYRYEDIAELKKAVSVVMGIPNAGDYLVYNGASHRGILTDNLVW